MNKKHFNIPIFIPELACPFQCIYCNQRKISGRTDLPGEKEIKTTIERNLSTIPEENSEIQIAYFGGNFTGIPSQQQEYFLNLVQPYIAEGRISGIRLSTRPDYINTKILTQLKKFNVTSVELGAQSMDNQVLQASKRGHNAKTTEEASKMIIGHGFSLGLQMMIGLPSDTHDKAEYTAHKICDLGAESTRIYPALVIKGTTLADHYSKGLYAPLELEEALEWSIELVKIFEYSGVRILKLGLHPSQGLLSGDDLVTGPFHPSFRELVLSGLWKELLKTIPRNKGSYIRIKVPPGEINYAIGYHSKNKSILENYYRKVNFVTGKELTGRNFTFSFNP